MNHIIYLCILFFTHDKSNLDLAGKRSNIIKITIPALLLARIEESSNSLSSYFTL